MALQLKITVDGSTVITGAVSSVRIKLADVVSKFPQPSPAINITLMAASHVSFMDGDGGDVLQKTELQIELKSSAIA